MGLGLRPQGTAQAQPTWPRGDSSVVIGCSGGATPPVPGRRCLTKHERNRDCPTALIDARYRASLVPYRPPNIRQCRMGRIRGGDSRYPVRVYGGGMPFAGGQPETLWLLAARGTWRRRHMSLCSLIKIYQPALPEEY